MLDPMSKRLVHDTLWTLEKLWLHKNNLVSTLGRDQEHVTAVYTAYCRPSDICSDQTPISATAPHLKQAIDSATSTFARQHKRLDWPIQWRASCTITRTDTGWQVELPIVDTKLLRPLIPGGTIEPWEVTRTLPYLPQNP